MHYKNTLKIGFCLDSLKNIEKKLEIYQQSLYFNVNYYCGFNSDFLICSS